MSEAKLETNLDREALLGRLRSSEERFLRALDGVSEEQSALSVGPQRWTIREVVEHVAMVEQGMLGRLKTAPAKTSPTDYEMDAAVQARGLDRSNKRVAPEAVRPTGRFASLAQAVAAFKDARRQTIEYLETQATDLRGVQVEHPIGALDGYQASMLMALHSERHAMQADEIKNHPNYR